MFTVNRPTYVIGIDPITARPATLSCLLTFQNVPPVLSTPHHYLVSIQRNGISLVAACKQEFPPLFVIEFLHRVVDTFEDYFSECNENVIKENYVIVYELLDEMLDNGFPLATECNILKELIKPPNILRTIANSVTGKSK